MNLLLIILAFIALILFILIIKFVKNIVSALLSLLLIIIIFTCIFGFVGYIEFRSLVKEIPQNSIILFEQDNEYIIGYSLLNETATEIIDPNNYYGKEYDETLQDKNKLIIFNLNSLKDDETNQKIINFLKGYEDIVFFDVNKIPDPKIGAMYFLAIHNLKKNPFFLIKAYRNNNLIIYPDTFKIIKYLN